MLEQRQVETLYKINTTHSNSITLDYLFWWRLEILNGPVSFMTKFLGEKVLKRAETLQTDELFAQQHFSFCGQTCFVTSDPGVRLKFELKTLSTSLNGIRYMLQRRQSSSHYVFLRVQVHGPVQHHPVPQRHPALLCKYLRLMHPKDQEQYCSLPHKASRFFFFLSFILYFKKEALLITIFKTFKVLYSCRFAFLWPSNVRSISYNRIECFPWWTCWKCPFQILSNLGDFQFLFIDMAIILVVVFTSE